MFYAIAVVLVLIADQALKYWVSLNIELNVGEQALIPGVIKLVNIHNSGAAFGLLSGGGWRWVFVVIAVVFTVVVIYALKQRPHTRQVGPLGRRRRARGRHRQLHRPRGLRLRRGHVQVRVPGRFAAERHLQRGGHVHLLLRRAVLPVHHLRRRERARRRRMRRPRSATPKRRSGGSHSKHAPQASRPPGTRRRSLGSRRSPAERTRIPVKEYTLRAPPGARPAQPGRADRAHRPEEPLCRVGRPRPPKPEPQPVSYRSGSSCRPRVKAGAAAGRTSAQSRAAHTQGGAEVRRPGDMEFSLEDILAEFSDK